MSRHIKLGGKETCRECGRTHMVTVTIDTWSGQAAFTCPTCDTAQEPSGGPVEVER